MSKDNKKVLKVVAGVVAGSMGLNLVPAMLPVIQQDQVGIFGVRGAEAEEQAPATSDTGNSADNDSASGGENAAADGTETTTDTTESVDETGVGDEETAPANETESTPDTSEPVDNGDVGEEGTAPADETAATPDTSEPVDNGDVGKEGTAPADETATPPITGEPIDNVETVPAVEIVAPTIASDLGTKATAGEETSFTVSTSANSYANELVRVKITLNDPTQRENIALQYQEINDNNYYALPFDENGEAWYGPETGFPLGDITSNFKVTFKIQGHYMYKLELVKVNDGTVVASTMKHVMVEAGENAPSITSDLETKATVGEEKDFTVTTTAKEAAGELVRVKITLSDPTQKDNIALQYQEINDGNYYALPFDENGETWYGPETGFPLGDVSSNFKVSFAAQGTYMYKLAVVKVSDGTVVASTMKHVKVEASENAPTIVSDLGTKATVGEEKSFTVSTTAQEAAGELVRVKITLSDPTQKDNIALQYQEINDGNYYGLPFDENGEAWYGPEAGFPLSDASSNFKVTFTAPGTYGYKLELVKVSDGSVLATVDENVNVASYKYDVAISQLDVQNLKATVTANIMENDADDNPVVLIFQLRKKISESLTEPVQLVAVNYDVPASGSEVKAEFNLPDTGNYLVDVMVWNSFDVATAKSAKVTQALP